MKKKTQDKRKKNKNNARNAIWTLLTIQHKGLK